MPDQTRFDQKPIEIVPIGQLRPYPRNARTHSKRQLKQIAAPSG